VYWTLTFNCVVNIPSNCCLRKLHHVSLSEGLQLRGHPQGLQPFKGSLVMLSPISRVDRVVHGHEVMVWLWQQIRRWHRSIRWTARPCVVVNLTDLPWVVRSALQIIHDVQSSNRCHFLVFNNIFSKTQQNYYMHSLKTPCRNGQNESKKNF